MSAAALSGKPARQDADIEQVNFQLDEVSRCGGLFASSGMTLYGTVIRLLRMEENDHDQSPDKFDAPGRGFQPLGDLVKAI